MFYPEYKITQQYLFVINLLSYLLGYIQSLQLKVVKFKQFTKMWFIVVISNVNK